jgi:hypothetical protein
MRHDIAHAAHFSEGEFWGGLASGRAYVSRRFTDDFNTPYDRVLFLLVCVEIAFRSVFDVCADEPRCFQISRSRPS